MKRVENRKVAYPGGFIAYYMNRVLPDGSCYRYALHLAPYETEKGRSYIASRLLISRRNMRDGMQKLVAGVGRREWIMDE